MGIEIDQWTVRCDVEGCDAFLHYQSKSLAFVVDNLIADYGWGFEDGQVRCHEHYWHTVGKGGFSATTDQSTER